MSDNNRRVASSRALIKARLTKNKALLKARLAKIMAEKVKKMLAKIDVSVNIMILNFINFTV